MTQSPFALGFRIKSGYAIAVAIAAPADSPSAVQRLVVDLSDPDIAGTKQPYHGGFGTAQEDGRVIARLSSIIERCAARSIGALLDGERLAGRHCRGAALVVGSAIDPATVGNPHIRAHALEGRLFRTVVADALQARGIAAKVIVEKTLAAHAAKALGIRAARIDATVRRFGETLGRPWRGEEKAAATAAWTILRARGA